MARGRGRGRKGGQRPKNPEYENGGGRGNYKLTPRENAVFETYYKAQGIVPEEEWDQFMETLRRPLPSTFRVTGNRSESKELLKIIKSDYFDKLTNVEINEKILEPPKPLVWYPGEMAWELDADRKLIRECKMLKVLHQFLITETESGNISRQEAVSMIPPLVLDVKSHHKVLDMCAAPGSKTAQLIEMLHADSEDGHIPEGCVVANDSDNKRCYLMTHQVKRLESPCFVIINHDASRLPNIYLPTTDGSKPAPMLFDRILADVPCSGDGTLRKNFDAWKKWNANSGHNLHNLQIHIVRRGLEMLAVGGRLVYSTCSLNPVEDEAVMATILQQCEGAVELVDASEKLPGLKWTPGKSQWKVMSRDGEFYSSFDELPERLQTYIRPSVFPPSAEAAAKFDLSKCVRVLPHMQNTGGFFIAVLEKRSQVPWMAQPKAATVMTDKPNTVPGASGSTEPGEPSKKMEVGEPGNTTEGGEPGNTTEGGEPAKTEPVKSNDAPGEPDGSKTVATSGEKRKDRPAEGGGRPPSKKGRHQGYREDPFFFLTEDDAMLPSVKDFYGLTDAFPFTQLFVRCDTGKRRHVYFASTIIRNIVKQNEDDIKIINLGLKILSRSDNANVPCDFRTVQDGLWILFPHVTKRAMPISKSDLITLLSTEMPFCNRFSNGMQARLQGLGQGSLLFHYRREDGDSEPHPSCKMIVSGWLGRTSMRSFLPKNDRAHFLRLCGKHLTDKDEEDEGKGQGEGEGQAAAATESEAGAPDAVGSGEGGPEAATAATATPSSSLEATPSDEMGAETEQPSCDVTDNNGASDAAAAASASGEEMAVDT